MGRSLKKGPFVDEHLMKKVEAQANDEKEKSHQNLVTRSTIFPSFIGYTIAVYDGRKHSACLHPRRHGRSQAW